MEGVCLQLDETLVNLNGKYLFTMASVPACERLRFWRSPSLQDSRQMKHMHASLLPHTVWLTISSESWRMSWAARAWRLDRVSALIDCSWKHVIWSSLRRGLRAIGRHHVGLWPLDWKHCLFTISDVANSRSTCVKQQFTVLLHSEGHSMWQHAEQQQQWFLQYWDWDGKNKMLYVQQPTN